MRGRLSLKRKKNKNACRECGKEGKYYYSKELAEFLKIQIWEGVYLCNKCVMKLGVKNGMDEQVRGSIWEGIT